MNMLRIWNRAGVLTLAAALLLAPGPARAANECGPLNMGNSYTADCSNAAYTSGIVYGERTHAVTLTVPGTATTATLTAAPNAGWDNGISVSTLTHASDARNISLTVGGTGTFVAIVQGSSPQANQWYRNNGIVVRQETPNGSTTTVDVKSGVTIGTMNNKMQNRGIYVNGYRAAAGAVSVTSGATIYSVEDGIHVENLAAGAVTVTNSGAITTDGRGIRVWDTGSAGAVEVTNSGPITSESTGNDEGIFAKTTGKDSAGDNAGVSITHSAGAIAVADGGIGIKVHVGTARSEDDVGGADTTRLP